MPKIRATLFAVALLPALAYASPAAAASASAAGEVTTRDGARTVAQQREIDRYWTPDRMRMAGALVPEITPIPPDDHTPYDPAVPPADQPEAGAVWTHGGAVTTTVGRLFFTFSDGYDGSCTATSVVSGNRSTILTAAHCFRGTGDPAVADTWNHNVYFVPGYRNGTKPYGGFTVRTMFTSARWDTGTDSSEVAVAGYDTGIAVVNRGPGGRLLADAVGSQRIAFRPAVTGEFVHAFGYPHVQSGTEWLGARMVHCAGPARPGPDAPLLYGMRCDMAHGASGGPHLAGFDPVTGRGTVVGVTTTGSGLAGGTEERSYATRLGTAAPLLYERAAGSR
ncbi:trypsin-like serine peptidase [Micromonospora sp. NPDC050397]|uniref:trypsin-like serine peptidase n=1 Tax=Micromonospora sp. NPDC050397 TaxID=3364279 RepID=UPI003850B4A3